MEKTILKFGDIEIKKQKLLQHKRLISIKNRVINKILISNEVFFGKTGLKYFIGYKDAGIRRLCKFLPEMSTYRRDFNETKYISFLINYDVLLKKYNEIWEKFKNSIKKEFVSKSV